MNIYSVYTNDYYPFDIWFPDAKKIRLQTGLEQLPNEPGIMVFWGGGDIHPQIYNRPNEGSHVGKTLSVRDEVELALMLEAVQRNIPIVGICRGAQLACAVAGGVLIQDVPFHETDHFLTSSDGDSIWTSSVHHQMMYPWNVSYELLAWSQHSTILAFPGLAKEEILKIPTHIGKLEAIPRPMEPEVVWFPEIQALAIQGHPEYMSPNCIFQQYIKRLIDVYILSTLNLETCSPTPK